MNRPYRPATGDRLREFLRARCSEERLRRVAAADYGRDAEGLYRYFLENLQTGGPPLYSGEGSPYEVALLQRHDLTADRPLNELFGAWWLGTFCWDWPPLIENLGVHGVTELLAMVVRGCAGLGAESAKAAHAALPFVEMLRAKDDEPIDYVYDTAIGALEAIERHGPDAAGTARLREFMRLLGGD